MISHLYEFYYIYMNLLYFTKNMQGSKILHDSRMLLFLIMLKLRKIRKFK